MEFETRIINGKPSIFFKEDAVRSDKAKKINTRDKTARKEIRKSYEVHGEVDVVKQSPRPKAGKQEKATANDKEIRLTQEQLLALINAIKKNELGSKNPSIENLNINLSDVEAEKIIPKDNQDSNKRMLVDKKKQKWVHDKELIDKLSSQEEYDNQKFIIAQQQKLDSMLTSKSEQNSETGSSQHLPPHKSTLTLAEKKRIQWQLEKENREDFGKFFNSSTSDLSKINRSTRVENDSILRKSSSLNNLIELEKAAKLEAEQTQANRNALLEKKRLQWLQDKQSAEDWMFSNSSSNQKRVNKPEQEAKSFEPEPPKKKNTQKRPPAVPKDYREVLDEYEKIKSTIEAITEAENKIKQEQLGETVRQRDVVANNNSSVHHQMDQSRLPAAMRTSLMFGDVKFDEDIKKTKEMERKQWLKDLEEQKNEQKKEKLLENQLKNQLNNSFSQSKTVFQNPSYPPPSVMGNLMNDDSQLNKDEKTFGRTKILLDPAQIEDMEKKRRANLAHKREIELQIEEKRRRKQLEEELQELDNQKVEIEARELMSNHQQFNEAKKLQPQYKNFEKIFNSGTGNDERPSVLQGESNRFDKESQTARSQVTDSRATEIYKAMQQAELAAAEEKHRRLLKRLQKGGHDTRQLERKFAEYKARLTGRPLQLEQIQEQPETRDTRAAYESDRDMNEEKKRQATLNRIFMMMRENTKNALPAELNEHDLKQLVNNSNNSSNNQNYVVDNKPPRRETERQKQQKQEQLKQEQQAKKGLMSGEKPIWNYQNMQGRKHLPNSMKDPFYAERARFVEERRQKRLEYFSSMGNNRPAGGQKNREFINSQQSQRSDDSRKPPSTVETKRSMGNSSNNETYSQQKESIMKLLTKNLASNPIYEEDEDVYLNNNQRANQQETDKGNINESHDRHHNMNLNKSNSSSIEDLLMSNRGYVPFLRTNEVLDPVHAGSPVPPSRESSAIKKSREKARQAYYQNMRPGDYGSFYQNPEYGSKDPLLNNGLVRNNPTPRQEKILSQLASLKQSLIKKQKEIASSISHDQLNYDDQNEF